METVLFGAGDRAIKFLITHYRNLVISEIWDNYKEGEFQGYLLRKPYYREDVFVIVTVDGWSAYQKIRSQLMGLGYKEFEHFIPHTIYQKRIALAYGNCHMEAVRRYLELHAGFGKEYGFYPLEPIQVMKDTKQIKEVIPKCKLIIHQAIRKENRYGEQYASAEILCNADERSRLLAIPNLHGMPKCFFPQLKRNETANGFGPDDTNIQKWIVDGVSPEEMYRLIVYGGVYTSEYIQGLWEEFKEKLSVREKEWDVTISDYIYANYQKEKLFTDKGHISTYLTREIAGRVLEKLGYDGVIHSIIPCMDDFEVFVYKDVKEALGLTFEEKSIRTYTRNTRLDATEISLKKYIEMCVKIYTYENNRKQIKKER